jgi:two-component system, NarL family, nitrate/nitrite response regulator NarL
MANLVEHQNRAATLASLTARERQIARLVMSGLRNKSIAGELQLCEGTVKIHLHNIYRKLGIRNRTALLVQSQLLSTG